MAGSLAQGRFRYGPPASSEACAFIVAKPLTTAGVNELSETPQRAMSASPAFSAIAPENDGMPARRAGVRGGHARPAKMEMLSDLPGGLVDQQAGDEESANGKIGPPSHPRAC